MEMNSRKGISPILATIILALMGLLTAGLLGVWDTGSSKPVIYKLEFTAAYLVNPVSVENAGWQIALLVNNAGTMEMMIDKIYVNNKLVEELGVTHGDSLSSASSIGISVPEGGYVVSPGVDTIYIWVGSKTYNKGATLIIHLQQPDNLHLTKQVELN